MTWLLTTKLGRSIAKVGGIAVLIFGTLSVVWAKSARNTKANIDAKVNESRLKAIKRKKDITDDVQNDDDDDLISGITRR